MDICMYVCMYVQVNMARGELISRCVYSTNVHTYVTFTINIIVY